MPKLNPTVKSIAAKYGLLLGAVLTAGILLAYFINWDWFLQPWFQIHRLFLVLTFGILGVYVSRTTIPGTFSFRDGFSAYFLTIALGSLISVLIMVMMLNHYDPDAGKYVSALSIEKSNEMLEQLGRSPEEIEKAMEILKENNQFSFFNQLKGTVMNLVLYCIPGVLIALIFKTKKPILV